MGVLLWGSRERDVAPNMSQMESVLSVSQGGLICHQDVSPPRCGQAMCHVLRLDYFIPE